MKSTGVNESLTACNDAAVPSGPVKSVGQDGVSSDHLISMKPQGLPAENSRAIKPSPKRGSSSGVNIIGGAKVAVSATAKGKSIVASFECTATIDDVVHGAGWYYIGCGVCHTKAIKGATTLMYNSKLSVYDHKDQAVFAVLCDAGEELTGKTAAELVDNYYQANNIEEEDHIVPVPQALIGTIGLTLKFVVKVSAYNLTGKSQTLTVTKVLPLETQEPEASIGEEAEEGPENGREAEADESGKRSADGIECEGA
ncbi:unnamed protein product [Eruca vesicaria subsp. sativa]|uniref:Uncharacterized protein n=1 Tax=Eruca vesicaria subsp. sativa TaxID=29727 RepID=A0ABC8L939_ERUVS|nr:unnamed protein product [Eruca vesicaria subsp. sativa]